jgi:hypothetical protein
MGYGDKADRTVNSYSVVGEHGSDKKISEQKKQTE